MKISILTESSEKQQTFFPPLLPPTITFFERKNPCYFCSIFIEQKSCSGISVGIFLCWQLFTKKVAFCSVMLATFFFLKIVTKLFSEKKKMDILKMSKKNILKILLQQIFAKTPKYPLFTIKFSVILYIFYKIRQFKGVGFFNENRQNTDFTVTYVFPHNYFFLIQDSLI